MVTESEETPAGYLFGNGNALFFDEDGEQMPEMQEYGLSGVHLFREAYPDAPVFWAIWGDEGARSEVHENVFDHITEPDA